MQRYVAACCTVFMHKQACLSISRCKHECRVISPETIALLGWSSAAGALSDAAVLSGCSRRSHLIRDLSPESRTRGFGDSLQSAAHSAL